LINREGVMNDGIVEVEVGVVRTAEMMVELELDAIVRLERRDAASVVQGSIRGMIRVWFSLTEQDEDGKG
jgi:hypothetical protein